MTLTCIEEDPITRDPVIRAGRMQFLTGVDAAQQIMADAVRTQLREHKYDQTYGIDYTNNVFLGNPNFQLFESQFRTIILGFDFVESIQSFEYNVNSDGILTYTAEIRTTYGQTTVSDNNA